MNTKNRISLTDCCQGAFGIVDMPKFVEQAIRFAYRVNPPAPPAPPPALEVYLTGKTLTDNDLEQIMAFAEQYDPRPYYSLDMSHIRMRHAALLNQYLKATDVRIIDGLESAYHPVGRGVAYTLFQFIYHEKNAHLAEPALIWSMLHHRRLEMTREWRKVYLALLIQIAGLRMDILMFGKKPGERPHYRANIVERPGLTAAQREERTQLFSTAVNWLFDKTVEQLNAT
ncbi:MAG: hypothetical protein ACOYUK_01685 [Patescibacteria group bacterium]